jgi:hypothetical protein
MKMEKQEKKKANEEAQLPPEKQPEPRTIPSLIEQSKLLEGKGGLALA